jgi:hypothetical protein
VLPLLLSFAVDPYSCSRAPPGWPCRCPACPAACVSQAYTAASGGTAETELSWVWVCVTDGARLSCRGVAQATTCPGCHWSGPPAAHLQCFLGGCFQGLRVGSTQHCSCQGGNSIDEQASCSRSNCSQLWCSLMLLFPANAQA